VHYSRWMKLVDFGISSGMPSFVVAEISANHNGDKNACIELIDIAASAGAGAVKFQTYTADTITLDTNFPDFRIPDDSPWASYGTLHKLYSHASTPWEWTEDLFKYARSRDLYAFSSAFDETALDFLESLDVPFHKIASPEINHFPLIARIARTGKPIFLSLGVASQDDLRTALATIEQNGNPEVVILQCDTSYPADSANANISQLSNLRITFDKLVGYSDHTTDSLTAILAVALGAKVFEKHLTFNAANDSVDSFFSTSATLFSDYIQDIRRAEAGLGEQIYRTLDNEATHRSKRSIYPKREILPGERFTLDNIGIYRPGLSLNPRELSWILGKESTRKLGVGERISHDDVRINN
jgi:pseudaminic acid synthase